MLAVARSFLEAALRVAIVQSTSLPVPLPRSNERPSIVTSAGVQQHIPPRMTPANRGNAPTTALQCHVDDPQQSEVNRERPVTRRQDPSSSILHPVSSGREPKDALLRGNPLQRRGRWSTHAETALTRDDLVELPDDLLPVGSSLTMSLGTGVTDDPRTPPHHGRRWLAFLLCSSALFGQDPPDHVLPRSRGCGPPDT